MLGGSIGNLCCRLFLCLLCYLWSILDPDTIGREPIYPIFYRGLKKYGFCSKDALSP